MFGTSKRDFIVGKATIDMPGPGNYDTSAKKTGPSYKFGSKTEQKKTEGPGPGAYDMNIAYVKDRTATVKMGTSQR